MLSTRDEFDCHQFRSRYPAPGLTPGRIVEFKRLFFANRIDLADFNCKTIFGPTVTCKLRTIQYSDVIYIKVTSLTYTQLH